MWQGAEVKLWEVIASPETCLSTCWLFSSFWVVCKIMIKGCWKQCKNKSRQQMEKVTKGDILFAYLLLPTSPTPLPSVTSPLPPTLKVECAFAGTQEKYQNLSSFFMSTSSSTYQSDRKWLLISYWMNEKRKELTNQPCVQTHKRATY